MREFRPSTALLTLSMAGLFVAGQISADGMPFVDPCFGTEGKKTIRTFQSEEECMDGKRHGVSRWWNEAGTLVSESHYQEGKAHGTSKRWYDDGQLRKESHNERGLPKTTRLWHKNGQPWAYGRYDSSGKKRYGVAWNQDGTKTRERGFPPSDLPKELEKLVATGNMFPQSIIGRADAYIIGMVGEEYFKKNYTFNREKSEYTPTEYSLRYQYAPLAEIGADDTLLFVPIIVGDDFKPSVFVASVEKGKILEPTISREDVLKMLEARNVNHFSRENTILHFATPNLFNKYKHWTWEVTIYGPKDDACDMLTIVRKIRIDAVTGNYRDVGTSCRRGW